MSRTGFYRCCSQTNSPVNDEEQENLHSTIGFPTLKLTKPMICKVRLLAVCKLYITTLLLLSLRSSKITNSYGTKVDYAVVIVTLSDWLKYLAPVFPPTRSKTKSSPTLCELFPRVLSKLQVIARNSDWLIALFAPVMNGGSNYSGIAFSEGCSMMQDLRENHFRVNEAS